MSSSDPSSRKPAASPSGSAKALSGLGVLSEAERDKFADLMEAVAEHRDKSAFATLFSYYGPRVKAYLMRLGADNALAEELAQDVMVTVWRKADLFDRTQASVSTWLFRIARNKRIDAIRRTTKPELDPNDPLLLPSAPEAADSLVSGAERDQLVRAALVDLPEEQRLLLQQAFYDGLSHREIAEQTGTPLGTVKSRLRLAFLKLRAKLDSPD
ncbi:ECF RNA polymerase sigma factor RpoE [Candidatus Phycosocius bacilliformis]|uniref:RNA polymerase sigma factor n=1 Tax=Candidatus Phycosocius bacilliformis TaxID=1445552 RepID=A0A2P2ECJ9_9PROT|nr:sigma-70 family RNA polymerase sigma factor [Candidatus Phycosocius bacilliformis]GBF58764.1 ECF RNA polymerase sigma factor RpoE [Candidatus Phycosocius bacilliformis]